MNTSNWGWNPSSLQQTVLVWRHFRSENVYLLIGCWFGWDKKKRLLSSGCTYRSTCELIGFVYIELQYVPRAKMVWLSMILDWWAFGKWFAKALIQRNERISICLSKTAYCLRISVFPVEEATCWKHTKTISIHTPCVLRPFFFGLPWSISSVCFHDTFIHVSNVTFFQAVTSKYP